jgi:hypothetical protein
MDDIVHKSGTEEGYNEQKGHIWLRYATQFTAAGLTHTIEMGIPMPIGASEQTRTQLVREAEAGIDALAECVERRVSQVVYSMSSPASPTSAQPSQLVAVPVRETALERVTSSSGEIIVPPTRPSVGASMPATPPGAADASAVMKIGDFVRYIKENFGLDPSQAMRLLNVKSLNNINLRVALVKLQSLVMQETAKNEPISHAQRMMGEERPVYFDEEVNPGEEEAEGDSGEDRYARGNW